MNQTKEGRIDYRGFEFVKTLGKGTHGTVILVERKIDNQKYALKSIRKQMAKGAPLKQLSRIKREVKLMAATIHPHIIAVHDVCESSNRVTMTMEYASGGELFEYVDQSGDGLPLNEVKRLFTQISLAVNHLHMAGIVHRDLKLENILLDDNMDAKIADFGLSNSFRRGEMLFTFCGSPLYASPEIVTTTPYYGPEVDCWSLGVILYIMAFGCMPFTAANLPQLRHLIRHAHFSMPRPSHPDLERLIKGLLTANCHKRLTIKQVLAHPWLSCHDDGDYAGGDYDSSGNDDIGVGKWINGVSGGCDDVYRRINTNRNHNTVLFNERDKDGGYDRGEGGGGYSGGGFGYVGGGYEARLAGRDEYGHVNSFNDRRIQIEKDRNKEWMAYNQHEVSSFYHPTHPYHFSHHNLHYHHHHKYSQHDMFYKGYDDLTHYKNDNLHKHSSADVNHIGWSHKFHGIGCSNVNKGDYLFERRASKIRFRNSSCDSSESKSKNKADFIGKRMSRKKIDLGDVGCFDEKGLLQEIHSSEVRLEGVCVKKEVVSSKGTALNIVKNQSLKQDKYKDIHSTPQQPKQKSNLLKLSQHPFKLQRAHSTKQQQSFDSLENFYDIFNDIHHHLNITPFTLSHPLKNVSSYTIDPSNVHNEIEKYNPDTKISNKKDHLFLDNNHANEHSTSVNIVNHSSFLSKHSPKQTRNNDEIIYAKLSSSFSSSSSSSSPSSVPQITEVKKPKTILMYDGLRVVCDVTTSSADHISVCGTGYNQHHDDGIVKCDDIDGERRTNRETCQERDDNGDGDDRYLKVSKQAIKYSSAPCLREIGCLKGCSDEVKNSPLEGLNGSLRTSEAAGGIDDFVGGTCCIVEFVDEDGKNVGVDDSGDSGRGYNGWKGEDDYQGFNDEFFFNALSSTSINIKDFNISDTKTNSNDKLINEIERENKTRIFEKISLNNSNNVEARNISLNNNSDWNCSEIVKMLEDDSLSLDSLDLH